MPRAVIVCVFLSAAFAACDRKPAPPPGTPPPAATPTPAPTPTPTPAPPPTPTPLPVPYVPNKSLQTGSLFNGINYRVNFESLWGGSATTERAKQDSYTVEVNVKVTVPKPHQSLEQLRKLNDKLDVALPGLAMMLPMAKVSPEFDDLYRAKVTLLRANLNKLDSLLTRHNFYDCETILELQHPETKRRAILVQSDMDVDTDGADGDRLYTGDNTSHTYQPFTSYRWEKKTSNPNPCIASWEKRISENEAKQKELKGSEAQRYKTENARLRLEIREMEKFSYLVGPADPFIVLPTPMFGSLKEGPAVGDLCVVIVGDTLYPAIVGDAGPAMKMGEASLRICKQIYPTANGNYRPVSDLKATYLLFPGTAERPMAPPNYAQWRTKCEALLNEIGGWRGELFEWTDITRSAVPPPTPPTPPTPPVPPAGAPPAGTPGTPATPAGSPTTPAASPTAPTAPPTAPPVSKTAQPPGTTAPANTPPTTAPAGTPAPASPAPSAAPPAK